MTFAVPAPLLRRVVILVACLCGAGTASAQVAFTEESLTGSGYTEVGVARSTPADTSVCTLAGPSPHCPIKLSDALGLGVNQGQYLALRIALQPTADTPTLRDWQVTYTCAFDE